MSEKTIHNTPFVSQMEDIKKYVDEFRKSKNNSNRRFNQNLKSIGNASTYGHSNQQNLIQSNGGYHSPTHPYQNVNMRRDNSSNTNGIYSNNYSNGYVNSKQKRKVYNSGNDYNTSIDNIYKEYNNIPHYNSNTFGRGQRNYTSHNNSNSAYNQNTNFTSHLRETYPQFYAESNTDANDSILNNNIPFTSTSQQSQIDHHKSLMVTSLYNTYSQNSDLNNLTNFASTGKYNTNLNGSANGGSRLLNSNESSFVNANNIPNASLFDKFNTKSANDGMQNSHITCTTDDTLPSQTDLYSSSSYGNATFLNKLSPMPSNELKYNDSMSSMSSNMTIPNIDVTSNAFSNLSPSHNSNAIPNIGVNFMNTSTGTVANGSNHNTRNMYLSQTTAPHYNGTGNGNNSFGAMGWNMNNVRKNDIAVRSNINLPTNNNAAISSSTMNKSFGIWNSDMKVWN